MTKAAGTSILRLLVRAPSARTLDAVRGRAVPLSPADLAKRRVQASLFVLVTLLLVVIGTSVFATRSLYRSAEHRYVKQALPLRTATRDIVLQMSNQEAGVLAYVITHDRASLAPYFSGRFGTATDLVTLTELTRSEPRLRRRLDQLRPEISGLSGYFARQIVFVADGVEGQAKAQRDVRAATRRFTRFRAIAAQLLADVDAFVSDTQAAQRRTFWLSLATISASGLLALGVALALLRRLPEQLRGLLSAAEEARREAELGANAARALAHTRDAVVLVDGDGIVRSWNTAAEWLFRQPAADALGRPAGAVMPGVATAEPALEETEWVVPVQIGEREMWLAVLLTTFEDGRVFTIRDVTDDQALERVRVEFVATASHELRTPVTSIYGAARTLLEHESRLSGRQRTQLLEMIESESSRLTEVLDRIIVSAQLDRRELTVLAESCDVPELCREVIRTVGGRDPNPSRLSLIVPSSMEPLETDAARLRQVLVNLLENAIKYAPQGTPIGIRVRDGDERVGIDVTDAGPGIPIADQQRVFEKFSRLDPQMARGVGGSGLGLYISRQIVERLGGRLSLVSEVDRGATFTIELPREAAGA